MSGHFLATFCSFLICCCFSLSFVGTLMVFLETWCTFPQSLRLKSIDFENPWAEWAEWTKWNVEIKIWPVQRAPLFMMTAVATKLPQITNIDTIILLLVLLLSIWGRWSGWSGVYYFLYIGEEEKARGEERLWKALRASPKLPKASQRLPKDSPNVSQSSPKPPKASPKSPRFAPR